MIPIFAVRGDGHILIVYIIISLLYLCITPASKYTPSQLLLITTLAPASRLTTPRVRLDKGIFRLASGRHLISLLIPIAIPTRPRPLHTKTTRTSSSPCRYLTMSLLTGNEKKKHSLVLFGGDQ